MTKIAADLEQHAVPIDQPLHHPENPRIGDVQSIAESLARFGQVRPICIQRSTGYVVAGNHTLKAARVLGWDKIAAVAVDLDDDDATAYLMADNRLADRGRYDNAVLRELMERASGNLAGTGFDEEDRLALLGELPTIHETEMVLADDLQPHDANYREHTPEQIEHLKASLLEHGWFREVVIANDGTVLAGHGILAAAKAAGVSRIPVKRLDCGPNDPEALRVLVSDNEVMKLSGRDDRALTEVLREIAETGGEDALVGTGHDSLTLANLVFVSRPESEVRDHNSAAEWVGMPEFEAEPDRIRLVLSFDSEAERDELIDKLGLIMAKKTRQTWSAWWPPRDLEDLASLRFQRGDATAAEVEPQPVPETDPAVDVPEEPPPAQPARPAVEPDPDPPPFTPAEREIEAGFDEAVAGDGALSNIVVADAGGTILRAVPENGDADGPSADAGSPNGDEMADTTSEAADAAEAVYSGPEEGR